MVAEAALGRAAAEVVLDAIAGEHLDAAVVHVDREVDRQLTARFAEDPAEPRVEAQAIGGQVELPLCDLPCVDAHGGLLGGHGEVFLRAATPGAGRPACWVFSRKTPRSATSAQEIREGAATVASG